MKRRARRTIGLTLIEMTLVIGTIALLVGFAVPAVRALVHSFQSEGGTKSMIASALGAARAMAASRQRYVGVRFQKLCVSDDATAPLAGLLDAPQYMIFIVHDETQNMDDLAMGFRAVEGMEPLRLPSTMGVMDLAALEAIQSDTDLDEPYELNDAVTFSLVFSPSGRLVVHDVRVRNRDGVFRPAIPAESGDDIFNSVENVCVNERGMFLQDDYSVRNANNPGGLEYGLGAERSRKGFVIYDVATLRAAYERGAAWSGYLNGLRRKAMYVSSYSGDLMASE
jgi:type II secretory pathway pseudopilin PulG